VKFCGEEFLGRERPEAAGEVVRVVADLPVGRIGDEVREPGLCAG